MDELTTELHEYALIYQLEQELAKLQSIKKALLEKMFV